MISKQKNLNRFIVFLAIFTFMIMSGQTYINEATSENLDPSEICEKIARQDMKNYDLIKKACLAKFNKPSGAKVERRSTSRQPAYREVYNAIEKSDLKALKAMIDNGLDVNKYPNNPLLKTAIYYKNLDIVKLFIKSGADPNQVNQFGNTPLSEAIEQNDAKIFKYLISKGARVKANPVFSYVIKAAQKGNTEILKIVLRKGGDVNEYHPTLRETALMSMTDTLLKDKKKYEIIRLLIKSGANVHAKDRWGRTVMHHAASSHDIEYTKILLKKGADINSLDYMSQTPLLSATSSTEFRNRRYKEWLKFIIK